MDDIDLDFKALNNSKKVLNKEEATQRGVGNCTARMFLVPNSPNGVNLWLGVNPCNKENLQNLAPTSWNKPGFPQVPLNLGGGALFVP